MHPEQDKSGTLFVVATPIGNRDDMSARAQQILADVDLIAAEDTRHTGRLLSHFGIKGRLLSLHEHNEDASSDDIILQLKCGKAVALVCDAGTPLVSDPGFRLICKAHKSAVRVVPVPGASAVIAALSVAGLPTDRFCFEGFLPAKAHARKARLEAIAGESRTLAFYVSVHQVVATLADLADTFGGNRQAFLGRELTKMHEQCVAADLSDIVQMLADGRIPQKGEFVVAVAGATARKSAVLDIEIDALLMGLMSAMSGKQAAALAAKLSGRQRNELYRRMLDLQAGEDEP